MNSVISFFIEYIYHGETIWKIFWIVVFLAQGIRKLDRSSAYDLVISSGLLVIYSYIQLTFFPTQTKYDRPVYLGMTRKSMICTQTPLLESFSGVKHWCLIIPAYSGNFYVIDVRGTIITELEPQFELKTREQVTEFCYGFHKLGLTNFKTVKKLLAILKARKKKKKKLSTAYTCQHYCHRIANFLVYPPYSTPDAIYGRMEYYIPLLIDFFLLLSNIFLAEKYLYGFIFDLDLMYCSFLFFDFFTEFGDETSYSEKISIVDAMVCGGIYIFLSLTRKYFYFNGYLVVSMITVLSLIVFVFLRFTVPDFPVTQEDLENGRSLSKLKKGEGEEDVERSFPGVFRKNILFSNFGGQKMET